MSDDWTHRERSGESRPYELGEEVLTPPTLPGEVVCAPEFDALIDKVAADLVAQAIGCVRQFGDFHLALSGGGVAQPLYERLMYDPNCRALPWRRTHLWVVHEAAVSFDDPRSRFRGIDETIVDHADIPREQVHPIFAQAADASETYAQSIRDVLSWREKGHDRLDYALVEARPDGGFGAIGPDADRDPDDNITTQGELDGDAHVSLSIPFLNASRFVGIIACGEGLAGTVSDIAGGAITADASPLMNLKPLQGTLRWYLDGAACGMNKD